VTERVSALRAQQVERGQLLMFPAAMNPSTVWTFHAARRIGAVPMPVPIHASASQRRFYEQAAEQPVGAQAALRLLTSGTTGQPKLVDLSETQLQAATDASQKWLGCSPEDRWLCCLPLHHIAGLSILLRTHAGGATTLLHNRFDPHLVNDAIDNEGVSMMSLVPTMLSRILDARESRPFPAHLRVILLGGAPTSSALLDRCRSIKAPVALSWGMTETAAQIATRRPGDLSAEAHIGHPLPGITVSAQDGMLLVEGPTAPNGRWLTPDRGHLDAQGRVVVLGRGEALIISGGENIDPLVVTSALLAHSAVDEALVLGRPDAQWGERVVAFVIGRPTDDIGPWVRARLAAYQRPTEIHWLERWPKSPMGKIDRSALLASGQ
jgi:O-succinylbenzoic acid--CoA ligase